MSEGADEPKPKGKPGRPKGVKNGQGKSHKPKRGRPKKPGRKKKAKKEPAKPYPPRQPKRTPRPPRSEKEAARDKAIGDARRGAPGGPGRPVGSRDARIILAEFGQLTLAQIKAKAEDPKTPIHDRAYLARWVRAQSDERTMMDIENRIHGMPTQPVESTIKTEDAIDLSKLSDDELLALRAIREKAAAK